MLQRAWLRWCAAFVGWTIVALFFASQTYLSYKYSGGQAHTGIILKLNLGDWYLWGLLAPGIIWLARRFPIQRKHWVQTTTLRGVDGSFRQIVLLRCFDIGLVIVIVRDLGIAINTFIVHAEL